MKRIIFVINNLETGGVQKSLLNLLKEIHNKYDITLLSFFGNEEYEKRLPENITVKTVRSPFKYLGMYQKDTKGKPLLYISRAFWVALTRIFGRSFAIQLMCLFQKRLKGYDYAISYLHEGPQKSLYGGCNDFVLKKIDAHKKIAWLHCDFSLCGADNSQSRKIYQKFDKIVACSEGCRRSFVKCMPEFAEKTVSIRNCNDFEEIRTLANDEFIYDKNCFNIVTVARLSKEKGIERALEAVSACKKHGLLVKYHIVGSGDQEMFLKQRVAELNLGDAVTFYGNQNNPYPYIKNADLFLLTSYHEAAPMVFDEAACLGVPVMATETTSTYEMLEECCHGIVCKNEQSDISETLLSIVSHPEKLSVIKAKLAEDVFDDQIAMQRLQEIIEGQ